MSFFERLFKNNITKENEPTIPFGRYSDSYRTEEQHEAWRLAEVEFEHGNYLEAYKQFFVFLRDEEQDNVRFWEDEKGLRFELLQGSKKVVGLADDERVEVETKIAKVKKLELSFMQRLMGKNYSLKYGRFALDDQNDIVMKFNTYLLDGSPYKLYDALKEIALNADKVDDLLLDEFDALMPIDTKHVVTVSETEKATKYRYICQWIETALKTIKELESNHPTVSKAYLLMNLSYKLDYLIRPEGFMMEVLERVNRVYFAHDEQTLAKKCELLIKDITSILERPKEELIKEMYRTTATFGVTMPVQHISVVAFIDGEIANINWYLEHNYDEEAIALSGYIVGYCLFNYAVPLPDKALFHLYYEIIESNYFDDLGYANYFYEQKTQTFNKPRLKKEINAIVKKHKRKYPRLQPKIDTLNYTSLPYFVKSYLLMIKELDFS